MVSTKDFLTSINNKEEGFTQGDLQRFYKPFIINRIYSQFKENVYFINELNMCKNLGIENHFKILMAMIPKNKKRAKWLEKPNDDLKIVSDYYSVSLEKAELYLKILGKVQLDCIRSKLDYGGKGTKNG